MLIRFNVKIFLSFDKQPDGSSEEFTMVAGKVRSKEERLYKDENIKLLKFAAIYNYFCCKRAGLMREIRNNNFVRHKTDVESEPWKKYILAFEGEKTEQKYFITLLKYGKQLGINPLIDFIILKRDICEKGVSNPKYLTNLLLNKMCEYNKKKLSNITLINRIVNILYKNNIPKEKFKNLCDL